MTKTKEIVLVAVFTSLTAIGAFISIPLGPVPITLQSFFVILSGIFLGPKLGLLSQGLYIIIGLSGIPILSGLTGGLQAIYRPSFGFLIGFMFSSYCAGLITNSFKDISTSRLLITSTLSTLVIYIFGIPYMYYALNILTNNPMSLKLVLKFGFLLFLPGDIFKIILISIIGKKVLSRVR